MNTPERSPLGAFIRSPLRARGTGPEAYGRLYVVSTTYQVGSVDMDSMLEIRPPVTLQATQPIANAKGFDVSDEAFGPMYLITYDNAPAECFNPDGTLAWTSALTGAPVGYVLRNELRGAGSIFGEVVKMLATVAEPTTDIAYYNEIAVYDVDLYTGAVSNVALVTRPSSIPAGDFLNAVRADDARAFLQHWVELPYGTAAAWVNLTSGAEGPTGSAPVAPAPHYECATEDPAPNITELIGLQTFYLEADTFTNRLDLQPDQDSCQFLFPPNSAAWVKDSAGSTWVEKYPTNSVLPQDEIILAMGPPQMVVAGTPLAQSRIVYTG